MGFDRYRSFTSSLIYHKEQQFLSIKAENRSNSWNWKIYVAMTFKVIITHPSEEGDEHTYYGIAFLKPGNVKSKRLEFIFKEQAGSRNCL
jgi:hypothetical protein